MTARAHLLPALRPYTGRRVVAAVSGGADSVALLRGLVEVGAKPLAAHFDHAIRAESAEDAAWVEALAGELSVPYIGGRANVPAVARARGWNLEAAARRLRYQFLTRAARDAGINAVLTAHTRRDQAETVLLRLLRGEAVLTGIARRWGNKGGGRVERPLLDVSREDIEAYLRALGQGWLDDPTNEDVRLTRVWLRREVLPALRERFPSLEVTLARHADLAAEDDAALRALAATLQPHTPLGGQPTAALRRHVAGELRGAGLKAHAGHIEALVLALEEGKTAYLDLPRGEAVSVAGGRLVLPNARPNFAPPHFAYPAEWQARAPRAGDRIRLRGGTRKLSDVLGEARVPRAWRAKVPLLVSPHGVEYVGLAPPVWAEGARAQTGWYDPVWEGMETALAEAHAAAQAQEVPVGAAVLGAGGEVLSRGRNRSRERGDMTRHAELEALRAAAQALGTPYLTGCTLVVTLEPCPMCLGAALEARVGRIVYGAANLGAGALGGVSDLLREGWGVRPEVVGGYRAGECAAVLRRAFAQFRREKRGGS